MQPVGYQIAQLRRNKGLSQARLAERAGLRQGNLSRIESGRIDPTVTMLCRIASALEVPPAEILQKAEIKAYSTKLTSRARIERLAKRVVEGKTAQAGPDRELAELFSLIMPPQFKKNRVARYKVYEAWARLRQMLTATQIKAVLGRIRDAEMRQG